MTIKMPPVRPLPPFKPPTTTHSQYKAQLRGMNDEQLAAEQQRLQALKADAARGALKDPAAVARIDAQLAEISEELAARKAIDASSDPAYGEQIHAMTGPELEAERVRQHERLREATSGAFTDPVAAADASAKLKALSVESGSRLRDLFQGTMPVDPATGKDAVLETAFYKMKLGSMTATELAAERVKLEKTLKDATHGAHKDPVAAANAQARLELVAAEEEKRLGTNAGYGAHLRSLSPEELAAEKAERTAIVEDASHGRHQDPGTVERAQAELAAIAREEKARAAIAESKDPAYGTQIHAMDDQALSDEARRQSERLREASSGAFKDPVAAADAQQKLLAIQNERMARVGNIVRGDLPVDEDTKKLTPAQLKNYGGKLRSQSDEELAATRARIEQRMTDASSGPHQDPQVVENLEARLKVLEAEEKLRAELKAGPQPEYALEVHQMSDADLSNERASQLERLREATSGKFQDPAAAADAQAKLDLIKAEQRRRNPLLDIIRPMPQLIAA